MKSILSIFARYVASAAGIAIILLVINLSIIFSWLVQPKNDATTRFNYIELASSLSKNNGKYEMSQKGMEILSQRYEWAMLLDNSGTVIWSEDLPNDFPIQYSTSDVASFTRWYYRDYPVYVWEHPDGLLVMGSTIGGSWKHDIEMPEELIGSLPEMMGIGLLINIFTAILLAFLFGMRMFHSIRPLLNGITDLAENKSVSLSTGGILGDLAEKLNQTSAQLIKQEAALAKRDSARTSWIDGISHDIRTPLSMVMGYSSQLEENPQLPQPEREQAGIIRRESEKIKSLVNDLNLASKLEYDMQPLRVSLFFPAESVRQVVVDKINNQLADIFSIKLNIMESAKSLQITGDAILIKRAVSNLLENSIKHNPEGCSISVELESDTAFYRIKVIDDGIGILGDNRHSTSPSTDTLMHEESGLGLMIVRQIMKSHGGYLELGQQDGRGCSAVLGFPLPKTN